MEILEDSKKIFVDTNILVFANVKTSAFHSKAKAKLIEFSEKGYDLYISNQIIREYLSVLSKPDSEGNKLSTNNLLNDMSRLETEYSVIFENEHTLNNLRMLLSDCPTGGKQIHDANIVATMLFYDLKNLLTHNFADFKRFNKYISIVTI